MAAPQDVDVPFEADERWAGLFKAAARFVKVIYIVVYFYLAPFLIFILNWKNTFWTVTKKINGKERFVETVDGIRGWDDLNSIKSFIEAHANRTCT